MKTLLTCSVCSTTEHFTCVLFFVCFVLFCFFAFSCQITTKHKCEQCGFLVFEYLIAVVVFTPWHISISISGVHAQGGGLTYEKRMDARRLIWGRTFQFKHHYIQPWTWWRSLWGLHVKKYKIKILTHLEQRQNYKDLYGVTGAWKGQYLIPK